MSNNNSFFDPAARRRTRRIIIQLLYQYALTALPADELKLQYQPEVESKAADQDYFDMLVPQLLQELAKIDELIKPFCHEKPHEITSIELAVMRLATFELQHCVDVPAAVIINEALELNKRYGVADGHKFVNAVLDVVTRQLRPNELK